MYLLLLTGFAGCSRVDECGHPSRSGSFLFRLVAASATRVNPPELIHT